MRPHDPLTDKWSSASTTGCILVHDLVWKLDMVLTHNYDVFVTYLTRSHTMCDVLDCEYTDQEPTCFRASRINV